jgi:hypothetical protein
MRVRQRSCLWAVILLAIGACGGHPKASSTPEQPYAASTLRVENHHWLDVNIFVVREGQRNRLGLVTAASTKSFTLPRALVGAQGEIRLIADPIGASTSISTDLIVLKPGTQVVWTLESNLNRSTLAIY